MTCERIVMAAYRRAGTNQVRQGTTHGDIRIPRSWTSGAEAGFVTSTGRFVGRVEALEISRRARQIRKGYSSPEIAESMAEIEAERGLMAESLYPDPAFGRRKVHYDGHPVAPCEIVDMGPAGLEAPIDRMPDVA